MDELISRQAALRTDCFGDGHDGLRAFHVYEDYKKMRDYIEALPSVQPEPKWIPVTEDKPRKRSNILVTDFNMVVEAYYDSDGNWFDLLGTELKGVTAWMPTPKPYREETEDE